MQYIFSMNLGKVFSSAMLLDSSFRRSGSEAAVNVMPAKALPDPDPRA